jgi:hypothetical protein
MPRRIQLRRRAAWRKPADAIVVTRATNYGDPYDWRVYGRGESVRLFRERLGNPDAKPMRCGKRIFPVLTEKHCTRLQGRDLACFCPLDQPCHVDVLLEWANR